MIRAAHRFFWGYGPSGFDILFREGEGQLLEAPCLDEVGRWKLAFDRECQVVTPVYANGQAIALLAFRSRVSARSAGDRIRQTTCAAIPIEYATSHAVHRYLLDLVPPFPDAGGPGAQATSGRMGCHGTGVHDTVPAWTGRAWARLLDAKAVVVMSEKDASLTDALRTVSLLPPALACQVAVGEGLLPGTEPRCHGLFVQGTGPVASEGVDAAGTDKPTHAGAPPVQLEGLAEAWFRREVLPRARTVEGDALDLWSECAADAECDVAQFDRSRLLRAMLSDVTHDWLRWGAQHLVADSLAPWMQAVVVLGVKPDSVRLAGRLGAMPAQVRAEAVLRMPQLATWLPAPDARMATVMVGAAVEAALQPASLHDLEDAFFDSQSWIGNVLCGPWLKPDAPVFASVAWSLVGELLALWAAEGPDVLARALSRPSPGETKGPAGWLQRLGRRSMRVRTIDDVLLKLAETRTPGSTGHVSERLLPTALRTTEGRCSLRPPSDVLEGLFARAVLSAEKVGRTQAAAVAAVAQLLARRPASLPPEDPHKRP